MRTHGSAPPKPANLTTVIRSEPRLVRKDVEALASARDQLELSGADGTQVFTHSPTGRRRQTGKNLVFATCCFDPTSIAGLTWGVSRDFETLGPVRDFWGRFHQKGGPAIWPWRATPVVANTAISVRNEQGPLVVTNGPYSFRDGLCNPTEWRRRESNPRPVTFP